MRSFLCLTLIICRSLESLKIELARRIIRNNSNTLLLKHQSTLHKSQLHRRTALEPISCHFEESSRKIINLFSHECNELCMKEERDRQRGERSEERFKHHRVEKLIKQEACLLFQLFASGLSIMTSPIFPSIDLHLIASFDKSAFLLRF